MTYNQRIINDRPSAFFPLREGSAAFSDNMGTAVPVVNGTPVTSPPLVVGGGAAYVFTGNDNFRFSSRLFYEESVQNPFSLEAWFKPVTVSGPKGIVGHGGQSDGLWFDGEAIHFTTKHGSAGDATASHYPSSLTGAFHAVGVHTGSKNELYVNGVRVAAVDLTDTQQLTAYSTSISPGALYVGHLSGSIIIDSVAVYAEALSSRTVKLHFLWGRDVPDLRNVVVNRDGNYWSFSDDTAQVIFDFSFDTQEEWASGETTSVSVTDSMLTPAFGDDSLTRTGQWQAGFILGAIADTLDGSKIEWDSDGSVTVQTSINGGASWQTAVSGREVPGIGANYTTASQSLEVRVNFAAGESVNTVSRMRSLSIKLYSNRSSASNISGQPAVFNGNFALSDREYQPIEHEDNAGVDLYSATALVKADNTRTLEFWVKLQNPPKVDEYLFDTRPATSSYLRWSGSQWSTSSGTTIYINGVESTAAAINIIPGRWTHVVAVLPNVMNDSVTIGTRTLPINVGLYANYQYSMSSTQVRELYGAYLGIPSLSVAETSGLRVVDPGRDGIKIYSYPWTLTSSG